LLGARGEQMPAQEREQGDFRQRAPQHENSLAATGG
jgi:hypothetical protein